MILYADKETDSIRATMEETSRRRAIQEAYNAEHGITPATISKSIASLEDSIWNADYVTVGKAAKEGLDAVPAHEIPAVVESLRTEMKAAAKELDFERAADLRDRIKVLEAERLRLT